MYNNKTIR